jgi:uncharacterized membrane protein
MEALTHLFSVVCGQDPGHTWATGGVWLPCCQRCTGLYTGALAAAILHLTLKPELNRRFLGTHGLFLLFMVPFGYHWVPQGPFLRAVTGALFGVGIVTFLRLPLWGDGTAPAALLVGPAKREASGLPEHADRNGRYFAGVLAAVLLVPAAGAYGGGVGFRLLTVAVCGGALVFGLMVLGNLGAGMRLAARGLLQSVRHRAHA